MILFLLLTLMTFGGPLAIVVVGRGGDRPTWPPDRPVEWWVFGGVTIGYLLLLSACVLDATLTLRRSRRGQAGVNPPESDAENDAPEAPR